MHNDLGLLSLFALGEDVGTEDQRVHAQSCQACAGEITDLHRVVSLGRRVSAATRLVTPHPDVWARIRDELGLEPSLKPLAGLAASPPALGITASITGSQPVDVLAVRRDGKVTRPSPLTRAQGAASAHTPRHELRARAELTPVAASWFRASGTADLAADSHGRRLLRVVLNADLPPAGVRQAWLVHRDNPNLRQTLGILDGPHGLWTVEHSIDLEEYAILDISQQDTGQTAHSGHTIVSGQLTLIS